MTTEDKFKAAVNVIRNLPKEGSYVPSNDLQLRFYAFFKQATNGANNEAKPAFWDVVGRAKWNAWKLLGDMPKETAMEGYVGLLMTIVETMSYNQTVDAFLDSVGSFYQSVDSDHVDLVLGPVIAKIKSQKQVEAEDEARTEKNEGATSEVSNGLISSVNYENVIEENLGSDDEEFCDTIATTPIAPRKVDTVSQNKIEEYKPLEPYLDSTAIHAGTLEDIRVNVLNLEEEIGVIKEQNKMIHLVLCRISQVGRKSGKDGRQSGQLTWDDSSTPQLKPFGFLNLFNEIKIGTPATLAAVRAEDIYLDAIRRVGKSPNREERSNRGGTPPNSKMRTDNSQNSSKERLPSSSARKESLPSGSYKKEPLPSSSVSTKREDNCKEKEDSRHHRPSQRRNDGRTKWSSRFQFPLPINL